MEMAGEMKTQGFRAREMERVTRRGEEWREVTPAGGGEVKRGRAGGSEVFSITSKVG